jgi:hypothetical protein
MPFFDNQSRDELRRVYVEAWRKRRAGLPSEPLEAQVADVIALHPEYHAALERGDDVLARDYTPESRQSNPFLHMGLHLAVRDFLIYGHGWVKVGWRYEETEQSRNEQDIAAELAQLSGQADAYAQENPDLAHSLPTDEEILDNIPDTESVTTEDRPFVERVSPFDIFVDPEATSPRDMRWIAQRVVRDLEEAKRDPRYRPVARKALSSDRASKWHTEDSPYYVKGEADRVTIWEFYDIARGEVSVFSVSGDTFLVDPTPMPYPFGVPFVQLRNLFNEKFESTQNGFLLNVQDYYDPKLEVGLRGTW